MTNFYVKEKCRSCGGSGSVKIGPGHGSADGPEYGSCIECHGTTKAFYPVKLIIGVNDRPEPDKWA